MQSLTIFSICSCCFRRWLDCCCCWLLALNTGVMVISDFILFDRFMTGWLLDWKLLVADAIRSGAVNSRARVGEYPDTLAAGSCCWDCCSCCLPLTFCLIWLCCLVKMPCNKEFGAPCNWCCCTAMKQMNKVWLAKLSQNMRNHITK